MGASPPSQLAVVVVDLALATHEEAVLAPSGPHAVLVAVGVVADVRRRAWSTAGGRGRAPRSRWSPCGRRRGRAGSRWRRPARAPPRVRPRRRRGAASAVPRARAATPRSRTRSGTGTRSRPARGRTRCRRSSPRRSSARACALGAVNPGRVAWVCHRLTSNTLTCSIASSWGEGLGLLGHLQSMTPDEQKRAAAEAAMGYVVPGTIVGVGTGSTADFFISALAARPELVAAAVASSEASAAALRAAGIAVVGLDEAPSLSLYVDGADEVDPQLRLIKGAGGALAREKVVASAAALFVCIVDDSKLVERLGDAAGGPRSPSCRWRRPSSPGACALSAVVPSLVPTSVRRRRRHPRRDRPRPRRPRALEPTSTPSPASSSAGFSRSAAPTSSSSAPPRRARSWAVAERPRRRACGEPRCDASSRERPLVRARGSRASCVRYHLSGWSQHSWPCADRRRRRSRSGACIVVTVGGAVPLSRHFPRGASPPLSRGWSPYRAAADGRPDGDGSSVGSGLAGGEGEADGEGAGPTSYF